MTDRPPQASSRRRPRPGFRRASLAAKIVTLAVSLSALLALALTYQGYRTAVRGLREQAEFAISADTREVTNQVDVWYDTELRQLQALSQMNTVRDVIDPNVHLDPKHVLQLRARASEALAAVASTAPDIESISLLNADGDYILNTNADDWKSGVKNVRWRDYVQAALQGQIFSTGVLTSVLTHRPCIFHSVPVRDEHGTIIGVLRTRTSLQTISQIVEATHDRLAKGAQGVLLDPDGLVLASSLGSNWELRPVADLGDQKMAALIKEKRWGEKPAPRPLDEPDLLAAVGQSRYFTWVSQAGIRYRAAALPLPRAHWTYISAIPVGSFQDKADEIKRDGLLGAVAGTIVALLLAIWFTRRVTRPIGELTQATDRIVSQGDLTQRIEIKSGDEVGQLAHAFSLMVDRLRELPQALNTSAQVLATSAQKLDQAASEQSRTLGRQATALQQTQVTAQELKETAAMAARQANAVLEFAERADQLGHQGQTAIQSSVTGLNTIRDRVHEIGKRLGELKTRTDQIGTITATVKDLADQSNMLALNAAIEAVRSGEHGKGFGVVAREIRSLADQSIQATQRVRAILEETAHAIQSAASYAETSTQEMESGLSSVKSSGDSLREISEIVRNNVGAVRQIAAVVNQQSAGISQIFGAVNEQSNLMTENQRRMEQTNAAAQDLQKVSEEVQLITRRYRV